MVRLTLESTHGFGYGHTGIADVVVVAAAVVVAAKYQYYLHR